MRPISQIHSLFNNNNRATSRSLSSVVTCAIKTPRENKTNKIIANKIILSEGAPPPLEEENGCAGTFIDQGEAPNHYFDQFPESNPLLGFFTWRWVLALGFDHMYSSPIFLASLALLAASLMACTFTTQIPLVKVARRWNFMQSSEAIQKQEFSDSLPRAAVQDLGVTLMGAGYEVCTFI